MEGFVEGFVYCVAAVNLLVLCIMFVLVFLTFHDVRYLRQR